MNNLQSTQPHPSLVIDLKKNRIRIHKKTLHMLGDPEYVQFLVNPERKSIAVRSSISQDYLAQKIKWPLLTGKQCCEFYSKYLLKSLRGVCFDLEDAHTYRITGLLIKKENLVTFDMDNSILIDDEEYSED